MSDRTHHIISLSRHRAGATAFALILGIGLVACGDDGGSPSDAATPAASGAVSAPAATTAGGLPASVINQVKFLSPDLQVKVGSSLAFDNRDSQAHTATADDNSFDTGLIEAGMIKSVEFTKAGTFEYHCSLHPFMTARVVVS